MLLKVLLGLNVDDFILPTDLSEFLLESLVLFIVTLGPKDEETTEAVRSILL